MSPANTPFSNKVKRNSKDTDMYLLKTINVHMEAYGIKDICQFSLLCTSQFSFILFLPLPPGSNTTTSKHLTSQSRRRQQQSC